MQGLQARPAVLRQQQLLQLPLQPQRRLHPRQLLPRLLASVQLLLNLQHRHRRQAQRLHRAAAPAQRQLQRQKPHCPSGMRTAPAAQAHCRAASAASGLC